MADTYLTIDIGNTNVTLGLFEGDRLLSLESLSLEHTVSLPQRMTGALAATEQRPSSAVIASVNPRVQMVVQAWGEDVIEVPVLRVRQDIPVSMPVLLDRPERLGDDRLMNGVAAHHRAQGAAIVVDLGTATTVEAISANGEYLGGSIGPGFKLSAKALRDSTALLPEIEPASVESPLGKNTADAMVAGVFYSQVGMVKEVIERLNAQLGGNPRIYATGGDAALIVPCVPAIDEIVPELTLEGIALTYLSSRGTT